jgi:hypothetical protein
MQSRKSLVGCFFHSFRKTENGNKVVEWQGQIISKESDRFYLVQLFSWIDGGDTNMQVIDIFQMTNWHFYHSETEMNDTYYRKYGNDYKKG